MPEYLAPGVYVEETSFKAPSIQGVATSTAGFTGPCRRGPIGGSPELVTSFADFERVFGGLDDLDMSPRGAGVPASNFMAYAARLLRRGRSPPLRRAHLRAAQRGRCERRPRHRRHPRRPGQPGRPLPGLWAQRPRDPAAARTARGGRGARPCADRHAGAHRRRHPSRPGRAHRRHGALRAGRRSHAHPRAAGRQPRHHLPGCAGRRGGRGGRRPGECEHPRRTGAPASSRRRPERGERDVSGAVVLRRRRIIASVVARRTTGRW
jgi:hypothetical protein